jgi:dienelactone hydrolase
MHLHRLFLAAGLILATAANAAELSGFKLDGTKWTYRDDQLSISGILIKPEGNGPFPAIVISHGRGGNADGFGMAKARDFVKMGFVCIATSYTHAGPIGGANANEGARGKAGGPGRGQKGKAAEGAARDGATSGLATPKAGTPPTGGINFGASEENLKRASKCIDILASLPYVDTKRIAAYGNSMGAFITGFLGAKEKDRLRAAAFTAGGLSSRGGGGAEEQVNGVRVPMLIVHGSTDTTVPPESSARFKEILDRNKIPNERHVFDGIGHNLHQQKADEVNALMRAWFVKYGVLEK